MLQEEMRYRLLKYLEENPDASQRQLARQLGVSLGKVNYCLKGLIEQGLVEIVRTEKKPGKNLHFYLLTPSGVNQKIGMTFAFLKKKIEQHRVLGEEIEELRKEARCLGEGSSMDHEI